VRRFENRLRIGTIGFVAPPVGFHGLGRQQFVLMAGLPCHSAPVMGCAARFGHHQARRRLEQEAVSLIAIEAMPFKDAPRAVADSTLEHVLCQIDGNRFTIHLGFLLG
jgi:hypothetical protein